MSEPVLNAPVEKAARVNAASRRTGVGPWVRSRTLTQGYCLLIGAFLLVRGGSTLLAGASFARPGDGWRAAFQIAIAALLLLSSGSRPAAYRAVLAVGATYAIVTVLGVVNGHDVLGTIPVDTRDKIVHPALAILATVACIFDASRAPRAARRAAGHRRLAKQHPGREIDDCRALPERSLQVIPAHVE